MPAFGSRVCRGTALRLRTIALLLLLGACGSAEDSLGPTLDLVITRITQPGFSGYDAPARLVIRTPSAWQSAWQTIWNRVSPVPDLPAVDFSQQMVIAAAAGSKPTSGSFITIESAMADRRSVTIRVRTISPGANCVALPVVTQPMEAVRIESRENVTFDEVSETRACGS